MRCVCGSVLEALVDEELGSVVFVMDYVQLDFSAARFSAYVWPTVTIGDATFQSGDPGYRDALRVHYARGPLRRRVPRAWAGDPFRP